MHSANDLDIPDPELWFKIFIAALASIPFFSSIFTLILYFCEISSKRTQKANQQDKLSQSQRKTRVASQIQALLAEEPEDNELVGRVEDLEQVEKLEKFEEVEQVMGSIIFCYCCSNLILSFLWFQIFDSSVSEDYGDFMAFMTIFCLYNNSFYQTSFKYYFLYYFKHKKALQEIGQDDQNDSSTNNGEQRQGTQEPEIQCKNCKKLIKEKKENLKTLGRLEKLFKETLVNNVSPLLISMNSKINALVNIGSFSLTALPMLAGNLGCGYLGDWSIQYKPEIQTDGVIFYVLMGAGDVIMAAVTLIHMNGEQENYQGRLKTLEEKKDNLPVAEKQERYYLRHIRRFIVIMTLLNLLFLSVNIYASRATENVPHRWTHASWKCLATVHFAAPSIQSFLVFLIKYYEPIPRD